MNRFWGAAWSQTPLRGRDAEGMGILKMGRYKAVKEETHGPRC